MNSIVNSRVSRLSSVLIAGLLAGVNAAAPAAWAGRAAKKSAEQAVEIVGRVDIASKPVTSMFLVEKGKKEYLYMRLRSSAGLSVVDVTSSAKARVIETTAVATPEAAGELRPFADTRAMILTTAEGPATFPAVGANTKEVTILDVGDPANPKVARKFTGVTSLVTDNDRGLIYIANAEGHWIVKAKDKTQAASSLAEAQND
jgi:hypothetical protein